MTVSIGVSHRMSRRRTARAPVLLFFLSIVACAPTLLDVYALSAMPPKASMGTTTVAGLPVQRSYGFIDPHTTNASASDDDSDDGRSNSAVIPFCYTVSSLGLSSPSWDAASYNFLATQVWPSARTAAQHVSTLRSCRTLCELGCGPGLPSLTAAVLHPYMRVIATDVDELGLRLVEAAAKDQGLLDNVVGDGNNDVHRDCRPRLSTQRLDLLDYDFDTDVPDADLYLLSDVFESDAVARASAGLVHRILTSGRGVGDSLGSDMAFPVPSRVWVFAQSDRAQRTAFVEELHRRLPELTGLEWETEPQRTSGTDAEGNDSDEKATHGDIRSRLWLYNVDETTVPY